VVLTPIASRRREAWYIWVHGLIHSGCGFGVCAYRLLWKIASEKMHHTPVFNDLDVPILNRLAQSTSVETRWGISLSFSSVARVVGSDEQVIEKSASSYYMEKFLRRF